MLINQQIDPATVPNPIAGLPSVSTTDLINKTRIEQSMGTPRIIGYIEDAFDTINRELGFLPVPLSMTQVGFFHTCPWETAPTLISHHHALDPRHDSHCQHNTVPPLNNPALWQDPWFIRTYKRAVMYEAAALISEDYADFDTTGQGWIRGANTENKAGSMRRIVSHAIADLTARTRNRISLL